MSDSSILSVEYFKTLRSQGYYIKVLKELEPVLDRKRYSKEDFLTLQIIKLNTITRLGRYDKAMEYLDLIDLEILEKGDDIQKCTYLQLKSEIFMVHNFTEEAKRLLDQAEQIVQSVEKFFN